MTLNDKAWYSALVLGVIIGTLFTAVSGNFYYRWLTNPNNELLVGFSIGMIWAVPSFAISSFCAFAKRNELSRLIQWPIYIALLFWLVIFTLVLLGAI
jgi:hypothetical protein